MLGSGTAGAFLFLPTPPHLWHRARNSGIVPPILASRLQFWHLAPYVYLLSVSVSRKWATTLRQKRTKTSILCSKRPKTGVPKAKKAQKCRFCAREEGKVASGSVTVVWNAKPWPGMQTRGAKKQEGGLNLGHPLGWLRERCERCAANGALRTMRAMRCGSEGALVVLLQVLCYRVGDEGESIHVPSLRPVGVNLCRFLH